MTQITRALPRILLIAFVPAAAFAAYVTWTETSPQTVVDLAARAGLRLPWVAEAQAAIPAARTGPAPIAVRTVAVEKGDFPLRRRTIGFAEPMASVAIKARLDSQIVEQRVTDGQMVAEGDTLFLLDDRELKAQLARDEAAVARDQALLERTRADLARKRDLVLKGATSQQLVDQAISDEAAATATLQADHAGLALDRVKLGYTVIRAPITGRVGTVQVTKGNLVKANDVGALATITQITPIRVSFPLPERDLAAVQAALKANAPPAVRTFAAGAQAPLATGKVDFLDSSVDMTSGTVIVKAIFDNPDSTLWPGQYLDVDVEIGRVMGAAVVPVIAVQPGQAGPYVFVVKPDQTVDVRPVEVGTTDGARAAVTKGLEPGEKVVVDGQMRLFKGARVRDQAQPRNRTATPVAELKAQ